ncbi:argininosuccinate lyase [Colletotrichum asianum]|uniref:Argininosuccinate lyase n=1 Tax=Colletotrichum asianum TaxID=702518 RepID=A0A8H3ZN96_9PEZI|nr:argininosuccinate lyase [Colletotrichum asianum]
MASGSKPAENKLCGGHSTGGLGPLHGAGVYGSIAFARANFNNSILTQHVFEEIEGGLLEVEKVWEADNFKIVQDYEDTPTANERRLGEIIGKDIAGKLHTGRSRNEQVVCDMRLWLRDELRKLEEHLISFLTESIGRGALACNPFNINREAISKELGFERLLWNSPAGVADLDSVSESPTWGSILMQHISSWSEDLIIYSSGEFGSVRLADAYSTGNSLMSQKRNPDSLERAPTTRTSWEPTLGHIKTVSNSIEIAEGVLTTLDTQPEKMKAALDPFMLATDLADYLVRKGVPFRETHRISGRCVALSEKTGIPMNELSYERLKSVDARFEEDIAETFNYEKSIEMRAFMGGTSRSSVLEQIAVLRASLQ